MHQLEKFQGNCNFYVDISNVIQYENCAILMDDCNANIERRNERESDNKRYIRNKQEK